MIAVDYQRGQRPTKGLIYPGFLYRECHFFPFPFNRQMLSWDTRSVIQCRRGIPQASKGKRVIQSDPVQFFPDLLLDMELSSLSASHKSEYHLRGTSFNRQIRPITAFLRFKKLILTFACHYPLTIYNASKNEIKEEFFSLGWFSRYSMGPVLSGLIRLSRELLRSFSFRNKKNRSLPLRKKCYDSSAPPNTALNRLFDLPDGFVSRPRCRPGEQGSPCMKQNFFEKRKGPFFLEF